MGTNALTAQQNIDPEIRRFLDIMAADWRQFPPFESLGLAEARLAAEQVRARWTVGGPVMAQTTDHDIVTAAGPIRVRVYRPAGLAQGPAPAMVYIHGGGFTLFSIETHDRLMREYAQAGGFAVIGVDYPLSPEAKYPVALDRITALLLWLEANAAQLAIDADRLALGGDSAGGNLSVAACLRLRDCGKLGIIKAVLSNYGGFSGRCSDESEALYGGPDSVLNRAEAEQYWRNYLNDPAELDDPYANPVHADLHGLPPVFLVIPELDLVAEHSYAMETLLERDGVTVSSKVYRGATHSFLEAMSISALACEAIANGASFIHDQLYRSDAPG
jgi:acetyl esterase